MTREQFEKNVDLYSADLSRWPVDAVKPALAFMEKDAAAKGYFDSMTKAEEALRFYAPATPDMAGLEQRIMAQITLLPQTAVAAVQRTLNFRPVWLFAPSGGLIAAAVIGFIIGLGPVSPPDADAGIKPFFYSTEQIISDDRDIYDGGIF